MSEKIRSNGQFCGQHYLLDKKWKPNWGYRDFKVCPPRKNAHGFNGVRDPIFGLVSRKKVTLPLIMQVFDRIRFTPHRIEMR